ncbi:MAG: hypothetical protein V4555_21100 [Acidobacteriota bacterium]
MKRSKVSWARWAPLVCGVVMFLELPGLMLAEPSAAAVAGFDRYTRAVEQRLAEEHRASAGFVAGGGNAARVARLKSGEVMVEKLTPAEGAAFDGAMLHDWLGTAFVKGATAADFERLMEDFNGYPQHFAPDIVQAKTVVRNGDRFEAWMRIRQRHVITVVMDASFDVQFAAVDARHGYSVSRSTRIAEIEGAGTKSERALSAKEDHGFLWRLDTYWSFEERDGGLYMQIESVSLTRAIPRGLGWAVGPFVESIPRESMEFTLRSAVAALKK